MRITYLSHSGLQIETGNHRLLIDPYLTDNPLAPVKAEDLECDFILLTHGHDDHVGDAPAIAKRTGATIIANYEIAMYYGHRGLTTHPMYHGGKWDFPFGRVKMVTAVHGSGFPTPDGEILHFGTAAGFVLTLEDKNIYDAGDTCLFLEMELIGRMHPLDLAFLPIGDNFTMGIDEAVEAVELLRPKHVAPIHYNTFPLIEVDPQEFATKATAAGSAGFVMTPGKSFSA